jgi:hypothetical protein
MLASRKALPKYTKADQKTVSICVNPRQKILGVLGGRVKTVLARRSFGGLICVNQCLKFFVFLRAASWFKKTAKSASNFLSSP